MDYLIRLSDNHGEEQVWHDRRAKTCTDANAGLDGNARDLAHSFRSGSAGFNDRHCRNYLKLQITAFVRRRSTMISG
jgi:hypothetical protein